MYNSQSQERANGARSCKNKPKKSKKMTNLVSLLIYDMYDDVMETIYAYFVHEMEKKT